VNAMPWWGWAATIWFVLWLWLVAFAICKAGVDPEEAHVVPVAAEQDWDWPQFKARRVPCAKRTHATRYDMATLPTRRGDL
jgi:hypothetical protein